jgi:hypothetical protein
MLLVVHTHKAGQPALRTLRCLRLRQACAGQYLPALPQGGHVMIARLIGFALLLGVPLLGGLLYIYVSLAPLLAAR